MDRTLLNENVRLACARVKALQTAESLVFPVFTDLHTDGVDHAHTKALLEALRLTADELSFDLCVNLGDNFGMLGRNTHIRNDALQRVGEDIFAAIAETVGAPILYANGNHDAPGTDFYKPAFWNALVKGRFGNAGTGYDEIGSYCYFDHEKTKTRLIVLSCPHDSVLNDEDPAPVWALGEKQLVWLQKEALQTSYHVIILMHVPPLYRYSGDMQNRLPVWTGESEATATVANLCGWIDDRDVLATSLRAFVEKGGRLVACLSGHTHADSLWLPFEERNGSCNVLPCAQAVTVGVCIPGHVHETYGVSFDIAVWTPAEQRLSLVRVGDGEDREVPIV